MVSLSWLKDGLVFTSAKFFKHQGAYTRVPERPEICDKCDSRSGRFHAHGRYQRSLTTLKDRILKTIQIWKHRWLCLCCGRIRMAFLWRELRTADKTGVIRLFNKKYKVAPDLVKNGSKFAMIRNGLIRSKSMSTPILCNGPNRYASHLIVHLNRRWRKRNRQYLQQKPTTWAG